MIRARALVLIGLTLAPIAGAPNASARTSKPRIAPADSTRATTPGIPASAWPDGTVRLKLENLEGLMLLTASIRGLRDRDTTGLLALDTGAGFLALDRELARWAGIADSTEPPGGVGLSSHPLPRLSLGTLDLDQQSPVMTVDGEVIRAVTDRVVLGLLGQMPLADRAVWIDPEHDVLALIPASPGPGAPYSTDGRTAIQASRDLLAGILSARAAPLTFRIAGDGKILLSAEIGDRDTSVAGTKVTLILDSGATKSVLFQPTLGRRIPRFENWKRMNGLTVPTLIGVSSASMALIPSLTLITQAGPLTVRDVDTALLASELSAQLSTAVGERVDGLLGASYLWRFRVAIDYPHRVLWLDPIPNWKNPRPFEYCHVGLQLERRDRALRVVGIVAGSPAELAGIRLGDDVTEINGKPADDLQLIVANEMLEGRPGTEVSLSVRHDGEVTRRRLVRRRLL